MTTKQIIDDLRATVDRPTFLYLMERWQGSKPYFPKNWECLDKRARNEIIKRDFIMNEVPATELAERYGLTPSAIYEIVRKQ